MEHDGCVRARRQRPVDFNVNVYGVVFTSEFSDGDRVYFCEPNDIVVGGDVDTVTLVILVNAPTIRKAGLCTGESDGETLKEFGIGVPMDKNGITRREVGAVFDSDRVSRIRLVITDGATLFADRTVGGRKSKGDGNVRARWHRQG